MIDAIVQVALAVLGLLALYLATGRSAAGRRAAPFIGLAGQPFWAYFAVSQGAWGLLIISTAYAAVYVRGCHIAIKGVKP